ncbi:MAG: hypothetical protein IJS19_05985 [Muribaculaceae bacterium]|nr:hypothetical protein [Muribaculaceae bacterium]
MIMTREEVLKIIKGREMSAQEIEETLAGLTLTDRQPAADYVKHLPQMHQEVATQAILNVYQKGWSLNDLTITREGRELNRKKLGIK